MLGNGGGGEFQLHASTPSLDPGGLEPGGMPPDALSALLSREWRDGSGGGGCKKAAWADLADSESEEDSA